MSQAPDYIFKVLVIGEAAVGKTSIVSSFTGKPDSGSICGTVGIDFKTKNMVVDGKTVKLEIWDTAGQERFKSFNKAFYRGVSGIMLVYDVTKRKSLEAHPNLGPRD